jgi:hypothetical protein
MLSEMLACSISTGTQNPIEPEIHQSSVFQHVASFESML